jgi:hypothetical protein
MVTTRQLDKKERTQLHRYHSKLVHYHVQSGFRGSIPEYIEICRTKRKAECGLKWLVDDLRSTGNILQGTIESGHFHVIKKTDALTDYCEIVECRKSECLKELD